MENKNKINMQEVEIIDDEMVENKIFMIRGQKVLVDSDLARLYGAPTSRLNEQVKRNIKRFPNDFMFQPTKMEADILMSQFAISSKKNGESKLNKLSQNATSRWGGTRKLPYVFTEQGVAMLSTVLNSERAILVNIAIMRTFVNIRKFVSTYEGLAMKIAELEKKYDKKIGKIFEILRQLTKPENNKKEEIGFKG